MIADTWGHGVMRWHACTSMTLRRSGDCTDAHSARMARMALWLWPDASRDLLAAIMFHDVAEGGPGGTGDVPSHSKEGAYLSAILERQRDVDEDRGIGRLWDALSGADAARLRFLDRLDAYRWAAAVAPWELSDADWLKSHAWLVCEAERLGVLDKVGTVL